jgi:hypothetical protein
VDNDGDVEDAEGDTLDVSDPEHEEEDVEIVDDDMSRRRRNECARAVAERHGTAARTASGHLRSQNIAHL